MLEFRRNTLTGLSAVVLPLLLASASVAVSATQPANRDQLLRSLNEDAVACANAVPQNFDPGDVKARDEVGVTMIPIVRHAVATIDQLPPNCQGQSMAAMKFGWEPLLIVLGDKSFTSKMQADAVAGGDAAVHAKLCLALADFSLAGTDSAKAEAAAEHILAEARTVPANDYAALALLRLRDNERLSTQTRAAVTSSLSESHSSVADAIRFAAKHASTQPSR